MSVERYPMMCEVDFFRRAGYLRLPRVAAADEVQKMRAIILDAVKAPGVRVDNLGRPYRVDQILDRDPVFRDVFTRPEVLLRLEGLLGPNIELVRNRHNHATANLQGYNGLRLHRDILQWSRNLVTAILYLEDATAENGATRLIPTSQYLPFVGTPNNGGTWMDEHHVFAPLMNQALPVPMGEGEILLFDSLAFHATGANLTASERLIVTLGFHSVDELSASDYGRTREIVLGERIYRGNDGLRASAPLREVPVTAPA